MDIDALKRLAMKTLQKENNVYVDQLNEATSRQIEIMKYLNSNIDQLEFSETSDKLSLTRELDNLDKIVNKISDDVETVVRNKIYDILCYPEYNELLVENLYIFKENLLCNYDFLKDLGSSNLIYDFCMIEKRDKVFDNPDDELKNFLDSYLIFANFYNKGQIEFISNLEDYERLIGFSLIPELVRNTSKPEEVLEFLLDENGIAPTLTEDEVTLFIGNISDSVYNILSYAFEKNVDPIYYIDQFIFTNEFISSEARQRKVLQKMSSNQLYFYPNKK